MYLTRITLGLHLKHKMFYWRGVIIINIITAVIISVFATNFIGYVKNLTHRITILTCHAVRCLILVYVFQNCTVVVAYLQSSLLKSSLQFCSVSAFPTLVVFIYTLGSLISESWLVFSKWRGLIMSTIAKHFIRFWIGSSLAVFFNHKIALNSSRWPSFRRFFC